MNDVNGPLSVVAPDDPRYCHDPDPEHPDHNFTYEYEDANGNLVTGS